MLMTVIGIRIDKLHADGGCKKDCSITFFYLVNHLIIFACSFA